MSSESDAKMPPVAGLFNDLIEPWVLSRGVKVKVTSMVLMAAIRPVYPAGVAKLRALIEKVGYSNSRPIILQQRSDGKYGWSSPYVRGPTH